MNELRHKAHWKHLEGPPPCLHCSTPARLTNGAEIYPHRPDLAEKPIWKCDPCKATVGCHPGGTNPLGFPADKATRDYRTRVHRKLDPLWKGLRKRRRGLGRSLLYKHLAEKMGLPIEATHVSQFTIGQCTEALKHLEGIDTPSIDDQITEYETARVQRRKKNAASK
jgi:hypothetical protein